MRELLKLLGFSSLKRFYFLARLPFMTQLWKSKTYYPEKKQKGSFKMFCEQAMFILKYNEPNNMYFLYGFDVKSSQEQNEYMPYPVFRRQRNNMNLSGNYLYKNAEHFNYIALLRDKFYFGQILAGLGFKTPVNRFFLNGKYGTLLDLKTKEEFSIDNIVNLNIDCYCKMVFGECGKGVFPLKIIGGGIYVDSKKIDLQSFKDIVSGANFLLQEMVVQHKAISKIYPNSVNTMRIITCCNKRGEFSLLDACLRVGANGNTVDNWAAGGLGITINNGKLGEFGFYEVSKRCKVTEHPDTHVIFKDYEIPHFKEAVEKCLQLHKYFYGIPTIGWDVSITDDGPCFIEGNDNYELSLNEAVGKGLKDKWYKTFN